MPIVTIPQDMAEGMPQPVYMDFNATTPVASEVVNRITECLRDDWVNPSSSYPEGVRVKKTLESARQQVASLVNCEAENVIFTSGGTEANNMAIFSAIDQTVFRTIPCANGNSGRPHVVTTDIEHDSVILPLRKLEKCSKIDLTEVSAKNKGRVSASDVIAAVRPTTCLITVMLANNETGIIQPVAEISRLLKAVNEGRKRDGIPRVLLHTDAAQAVGKIAVDFRALGTDYLAVVGHKFYGPRTGALVVRDRSSLVPVFYGGGQEGGLRPGTENVAMAAGLGEAARVARELLPQVTSHLRALRDLLEQRLEEELGRTVVFNCRPENPLERLPNTSSVSLGVPGASVLAQCGRLRASTGSACHATGHLSGVLLASGVPKEQARCTLRLSIGRETTEDDVETAVAEIVRAVRTVEKSSAH